MSKQQRYRDASTLNKPKNQRLSFSDYGIKPQSENNNQTTNNLIIYNYSTVNVIVSTVDEYVIQIEYSPAAKELISIRHSLPVSNEK